MVKKIGGIFIVFSVVMFFLLTACPLPNDVFAGASPLGENDNLNCTGSLTIGVSMNQSRTFLPEIDMEPASFDIIGNGPMDKKINESITNDTLLLPKLLAGEWTFVVYAKNENEVVIGQGSETVIIVAKKNTSTSIAITPIKGTGNFNLEASWPSMEVANPVIVSELHPASGPVIESEIKLSTEGNFSFAHVSYEELTNGYYTLRFKLYDGEVLKIGAMEVVRILAGQLTSGSISFNDLCENTGNVVVNIDVQLDDPIDISLSPAQMNVQPGREFKINPIISSDTGNVLYTWYVNGEQVDNKNDDYFVFNETNIGLYRIDVKCFLADGSRVGSANSMIKVSDTFSSGGDDWTFMVYLDGDNDLEGYALQTFNMMEAVDLESENINIIVLFDRISRYNSTNGDWTGTRLYKVKYNPDNNIILHSVQLSGMGLSVESETELNMGDGATLNRFVDFCQYEYPASNYALIFYDHGNGWYSKMPEESSSKSVCYDFTDENDSLGVKEIKEILLNKDLDVIGFDACLMAMVEVAYELKDCADIMIASEKEIYAPGWDFRGLLEKFKFSDKSPEALATAAVESLYDYNNFRDMTLSGIRLDKMDNLVTAINSFADNLVQSDFQDIKRVRDLCQIYASSFSIDLYDFADHVSCSGAEEVKSALKEAVIANKQNIIDGNGLCIFFPKTSDNFQYSAYNTEVIDFPGNSSWDEFLAAFVDLPVNTDSYEPDNSSSEASKIEIGEIQNHNFHSNSDMDYFQFKAIAGHRYTIDINYRIEDELDIKITLYDNDGAILQPSIANKNSMSSINKTENNLIDAAWGTLKTTKLSWNCSFEGVNYFSIKAGKEKIGEYSITFKDTTPGILEPVEWCGRTWIPNTLGKWSVQGDEFIMTGNNTDTYSYAETKNTYENFSFSVDVMKSEGMYFLGPGIIFRKNNNNFYLFYVSAYNGYYSIVKYTDGKPSSSIEKSNPDAIKPGLMTWNSIRMEAAGSEFTFYANDILLTTLEDSSYTEGSVGLFSFDVMDDIDHFKNAVITENVDNPAETPAPDKMLDYGIKIMQDIMIVLSNPELPSAIVFSENEQGIKIYKISNYSYLPETPEAVIQGEISTTDFGLIAALRFTNDPQGVRSIVLGFGGIIEINGISYPIGENIITIP